MKTSREILTALRDARGSETVLQGDHLDAVVSDLEDLARREREWNASVDDLVGKRDDSTPPEMDDVDVVGAPV